MTISVGAVGSPSRVNPSPAKKACRSMPLIRSWSLVASVASMYRRLASTSTDAGQTSISILTADGASCSSALRRVGSLKLSMAPAKVKL